MPQRRRRYPGLPGGGGVEDLVGQLAHVGTGAGMRSTGRRHTAATATSRANRLRAVVTVLSGTTHKTADGRESDD